MLVSLWHIAKETISVFCSSLSSAYVICALTNTPFYDSSITNGKLITMVKESVINLAVIGTEIIGAAYLYYPTLDTKSHSLIRTVSNIIEYSMWIELFYYGYHRLLHTSYWYSLIHAKHHTSRIVYPIDALNIGPIDATGMIFTLIAPMWFVQISVPEYHTIMFLYLTGSFLTHSRLFVDRHVLHHEKYKCNYSFLFPIFDYAFDTLRSST
jgi:hypothetical protein